MNSGFFRLVNTADIFFLFWVVGFCPKYFAFAQKNTGFARLGESAVSTPMVLGLRTERF